MRGNGTTLTPSSTAGHKISKYKFTNSTWHGTKDRGVRWLSGRVIDSGSRGYGFEPHRRHCVLSLSKTLYPSLSTGSTQADPSRHD